MKFRIAAFGLCLISAASLPVRSAVNQPDRAAQAFILQSERNWTATNPKEVALVKGIVADEYVGIYDGRVFDKAGARKDAARGPGDVMTERVDSIHLRFFGNAAIVQGTSTSIHKDGRKTHAVFVDTWIMHEGRWQVVASADASVACSRLAISP